EPAQHLQQGRQVAGSHRAQHQRGVQRTAHACSPRNASRRASSQTSTPSSVALASFEPASAPATTNPVFFDTLPDTLAPRASSFAFASSRPIESSVPVITTVTPSSGPSAAASPGSAASSSACIAAAASSRRPFPSPDSQPTTLAAASSG